MEIKEFSNLPLEAWAKKINEIVEVVMDEIDTILMNLNDQEIVFPRGRGMILDGVGDRIERIYWDNTDQKSKINTTNNKGTLLQDEPITILMYVAEHIDELISEEE